MFAIFHFRVTQSQIVVIIRKTYRRAPQLFQVKNTELLLFGAYGDWLGFSSSAALDRAQAMFRGCCELTEAVCDSKWSGEKLARSKSEWFFVGQAPADLCLLLLKWLACTSNLAGLHTPQSLIHPSWRCSVVLAPVTHRPSCKGYNSCLCLGWENTAWLQC